ncbi:LOW QUALITY PROTEIN: hypothetical protein RJ639_028098 [Escallonia herrerae]|uniref:Uncharacterized protein n=1 Tax=Escallonia herrerae TaxID=1293975 RepID=A0AA88X411_9ASTE|nr:LOW QUALITY PROTEIN: hypothetical protein RJ639_028098 [Escallonia herrerae]
MEPHDLASAMAIVERLEDFKQRERPRSPRHECAKGRGDSNLKSDLPKATDDERNGDERHHRHHKGKRSTREVTSGVILMATRLIEGLEENASTVSALRERLPTQGQDNCIPREAQKQQGGFFQQRWGGTHGGITYGQCVSAKVKGRSCQEKGEQEEMGLALPKGGVAEKTQEVLVDTRATHNFMSPWVTEWLGLKSNQDESWFTTVNTEERPTKGVVKNVNLRIGRWTGKAEFNIIDMDELGVVLRMDFLEKPSATLNPYCRVMMMVGKQGQPKWMIPLVSKDGTDAQVIILMSAATDQHVNSHTQHVGGSIALGPEARSRTLRTLAINQRNM